jgi:hypothetical protein
MRTASDALNEPDKHAFYELCFDDDADTLKSSRRSRALTVPCSSRIREPQARSPSLKHGRTRSTSAAQTRVKVNVTSQEEEFHGPAEINAFAVVLIRCDAETRRSEVSNRGVSSR